MFAGNFSPQDWAFCNGAIMSISQNETLFTLIGTTYGGDGEQTFALPDLRGRVPVHQGQGSASAYAMGQIDGVESVTLTNQHLPPHTHPMLASTGPGASPDPRGKVVGSPPAVTLFTRESPSLPMAANMVAPVGGSEPHENRMPYLVINYIISLYGIFPTQS